MIDLNGLTKEEKALLYIMICNQMLINKIVELTNCDLKSIEQSISNAAINEIKKMSIEQIYRIIYQAKDSLN